MHLTKVLAITYRVHNIPYRYRGKYRKTKEPTATDIRLFREDLLREEWNMFLLRHPYLTSEQSHGHMSITKEAKHIKVMHNALENRNQKYNKIITIADRLEHLKVKEAWD